MPTPSEYQNFPTAPTPQPAPDDTTTPGKSPDETRCAELQPLFDVVPTLKEQLGCTFQLDTTPVVNECDTILNALKEVIRQDLNACIDPARLSHEQCVACINGALQRDIGYINTVTTQCGQKINDQLMSYWYELVAAMDCIGIKNPTKEQIDAILAGIPIPANPTVPDGSQPPDIPPNPVPTAPNPTGDGGTEPTTPTSPGTIPVYTGPITVLPSFPVGPTAPTGPVPPEQTPPIGKPLVCPPGTTQVGGPGGVCIPNAPPIVQPQPPQPEQAVIYVMCANQPNVPVSQVVTSPSQIPGWIADGYSVLAGPFPNSTDGGQAAANWINNNQSAVQACMRIVPPGPGGPQPPSPMPDCKQCGAGYDWGTDANGNPVCKPSCSCPVCPTTPPPPPPEQPPPPPPAPTPPGEQPPGLCGPSDAGAFEKFIEEMTTALPVTDNFECKPGIGSFLIDLAKTLNPLSTAVGPKDFFGHLGNTVECAANWAYSNVVKAEWPQGSCQIGKVAAHYLATVLPTILDKLFGIVPPQVKANMEMRGNYLCQYKVPTTNDINTAWIHGALTNDEWEFGVKINGDCIDWQKKLIQSEYIAPGWQDAMRIKRLEKIGGEEFYKILQRAGMNTDKDIELFEKVYAQYPGFADLVRMMVRDSADEQAVADNRFDEDFDKKFVGKLQQWADAQGITDEVAKMYWRAHWNLPSPEQLYQMLHRLRPTDRDKDDQFGDVQVTTEQVESVLKQNDMAPKWVKPLMAISYPPLTRIDARRAFEIGAIDETELYHAYLDLGYSKENAKRLVQFTLTQSGPKRAQTNGAMSQSELAKAYNSRLISDDEYVQGLRQLFNDDARVENVYENQQFKRDVAERGTVLKAFKRRFMFGEFDRTRTVSELIGFGIDPTQADKIVNLWEQELSAKYKAPTVAMLCEWYTRGLISLTDYMSRVRNLGYSQDDAMRIVQTCAGKNQERIAKELAAAQQKAQSRAEKQRKALEKAAADAMPCRIVKPKCPMPGTNGTAH